MGTMNAKNYMILFAFLLLAVACTNENGQTNGDMDVDRMDVSDQDGDIEYDLTDAELFEVLENDALGDQDSVDFPEADADQDSEMELDNDIVESTELDVVENDSDPEQEQDSDLFEISDIEDIEIEQDIDITEHVEVDLEDELVENDACEFTESNEMTEADTWENEQDIEYAMAEGFVAIPTGGFWMGSPDCLSCPVDFTGNCNPAWCGGPCRQDSELLHYVQLTIPFEIQQHEATQEEFEALMGYNPAYFGSNGQNLCTENCPVEGVMDFDAMAFANELSKRAGLTPCYVFSNIDCWNSEDTPPEDQLFSSTDYMVCYRGQTTITTATVTLNGVTRPQDCEGYRLPTEAEWEYAAKAGTTTDVYSGNLEQFGVVDGDCDGPCACTTLDPNLDRIAWYYANVCNGEYSTRSIMQKEPNAWTLYDMLGNVEEYIHRSDEDCYPESTTSNPDIDPFREGQNLHNYSYRGGSYDLVDPCELRAAHRAAYISCNVRESLADRKVKARERKGGPSHGFRLVRSLR